MQLRKAKRSYLAALGVAAALACASAPALADGSADAVTVNGAFSAGTIFTTSGVNAVGSFDSSTGADESTRTNVTNALLTVSKTTGTLRFGLTAGIYDFPVVGFAGNPTIQKGANTTLFTPFPSAYVAYAPTSNLTVSAGQQLTLIGSEGVFTYQNVNIQRGLLWNMEPVASRGVRATYTGAKVTAAYEVNDGYYSGTHWAQEGMIGYNTSPSTNVAFAFILPQAGTPGNVTAGIANKREYNLMLTTTAGRWSLTPYLLFVDSPANSGLGYTVDEHAAGGSLLGSYALTGAWSLGARVEYVKNGSSTTDTSPNADLIGYGPGSSAWSYTLTPTYRYGHGFFRAEASSVSASDVAPGIGFGSAGTQSSQFRLAVEVGASF
ncbi:MAG TPA: outer membrane beta-barrel protein [Candidatus Dormibacteraeota bacterium]|nr:outer membrane beta-barrel protein [Candidatus Dormibacteraeota bacterium]